MNVNEYAWKIASGIVLALLIVFVLQRMGFRFVVSSSVGVGA